MKQDIILSGVGGQGILSIATVIADAAMQSGLHIKQAEVHGMSQRGGDVQSNLRLSTEIIHSDLIPMGKADLIISMEPMEALRYVQYLCADGKIVCSSQPLINIPNYPEQDAILKELSALPNVMLRDIDALAKDNFYAKGANMILLGMASACMDILQADQIKASISRIFKSKGEKVVESNIKAFETGYQSAKR